MIRRFESLLKLDVGVNKFTLLIIRRKVVAVPPSPEAYARLSHLCHGEGQRAYPTFPWPSACQEGL